MVASIGYLMTKPPNEDVEQIERFEAENEWLRAAIKEAQEAIELHKTGIGRFRRHPCSAARCSRTAAVTSVCQHIYVVHRMASLAP
jgi:hypothetical protein